MIILILTISFLQIIFSTTENLSNIRYNPLISAQCKARCLYEYRNHSYYHRSYPSMFINGKMKRLLSTNVLSLPWRSIWERCPRLITCSSCLLPCDLDPPLLLSNKQTCQAICSTLKIFECEQSCLFIQNLYEQESNCLISNCSEKIVQPSNVIAIERKSRRTVRLKWNSNQQTNSEPIFYVIEAQWTLPKADLLVSKWGFVKEEVSNTKAIIRNIQRDNRWYKFRVAAVTRHGYSAFSVTDKSFRLTNQSIIIEPPKNFSIKTYQLNSNTINITLQWEQSDSFVDEYQISWEEENIDTSSLELTIPFLSLNKLYLFQIRSIIKTSDNQIQMSLPLNLSFNYEDEIFTIKNFQISKAYFINGLIKSNLSWNNNYHLKQYDISWIEHECYSEIFSCCYKRNGITIKNSFQLYDLRFNCLYLINIKIIGWKNLNKSFQIYFNVTSCEFIEIYETIQPPCQTDRKTMDIFSSLPTFDIIVTNNHSGLNLFWQNIDSVFSNNIFYQLYIEQLPDHSELISVKLPLMITNYFIPYSKIYDNHYLNVTLYLIDNITIRQQQSILIHDKRENNIKIQLKNNCSANYFNYLFLIIIIIRFCLVYFD